MRTILDATYLYHFVYAFTQIATKIITEIICICSMLYCWYKHTAMSYLIYFLKCLLSKLFSLVLNKKGNLLDTYRDIYYDFPNLTFFFFPQVLVFHLVWKLIIGFQNIQKNSGIKKIQLLGIHRAMIKSSKTIWWLTEIIGLQKPKS